MAGVAVQPLVYQDQADFSAGAFPGLEVVPPNGAEDIVNGVPDVDGSVFRRGPSTYKGGTVPGTVGNALRSLWDGYVAAGPRTLVTRAETGEERLATLDATDTTWVDLFAGGGGGIPVRARPMVIQGMLAFVYGLPGFGVTVRVWAGARGGKPSVFGQTMTVTNGSRTVTGTNFTTNAEKGTLLYRAVGAALDPRIGVVESVDSATSLTLTKPWQGPTETYGSFFLTPMVDLNVRATVVGSTMFPAGAQRAFGASMFDRLVLARGSRIGFTAQGDPLVFANDDDYHELPAGARVIGLEPLRDLLLVFTTQGLFTLSGLAFELTDAQGNVQQQLERVDSELVLWDNRGIAAWESSVVAPCTNDVFLVATAGGARPITGGMRRLYRSYVKAGYQTGLATAYDGRYLLPILNGDAWIDTLVCDLRTGAWTRWDGHGGRVGAFARRVGDDTRQPKLLAASLTDQRVLDETGAFDPQSSGSSSDADSSSYDLKVTTRTLNFGDLVGDMWRRFRARFEGLQTTPSVTLEYATGKPGSSFTTVGSPNVKTVDNEQIYSWHFNETTRAIRFRLTVHSGSSREVLRSLQAGARLSAHHRP